MIGGGGLMAETFLLIPTLQPKIAPLFLILSFCSCAVNYLSMRYFSYYYLSPRVREGRTESGGAGALFGPACVGEEILFAE